MVAYWSLSPYLRRNGRKKRDLLKENEDEIDLDLLHSQVLQALKG